MCCFSNCLISARIYDVRNVANLAAIFVTYSISNYLRPLFGYVTNYTRFSVYYSHLRWELGYSTQFGAIFLSSLYIFIVMGIIYKNPSQLIECLNITVHVWFLLTHFHKLFRINIRVEFHIDLYPIIALIQRYGTL